MGFRLAHFCCITCVLPSSVSRTRGRCRTTPGPADSSDDAARRPHPPHRVPLRPPGERRTAGRSACGRHRTAARRSSPTRCTSSPSRTSSTGSRTRSATSWRAWWCRTRRASCRHGRSRRRHGGHQSVRLLRRGERGQQWPFAYDPELPASSSPTSSRCRASPCSMATSPASIAAAKATDRLHHRPQSQAQPARSPTACAWSRACRRRRRRCRARPARAATPAGCWCRSCATSASPRASCRAT